MRIPDRFSDIRFITITRAGILKTMEDTVTVWLDEEYGFRYWKWDTRMSADELVTWWKNMKTVTPFFYSVQTLPGFLTLCDSKEWDEGTRNMPSEVPPGFDEAGELPESIGDDSEEMREFVRYYARLSAATRKEDIYRAHIHQDDDSGLFLPNGDTVRHAGYVVLSWEDDENEG